MISEEKIIVAALFTLLVFIVFAIVFYEEGYKRMEKHHKKMKKIWRNKLKTVCDYNWQLEGWVESAPEFVDYKLTADVEAITQSALGREARYVAKEIEIEEKLELEQAKKCKSCGHILEATND